MSEDEEPIEPMPEWLDGPDLYEWILKRCPYIKGDREGILGYTHSRSMVRWRSGERAHYATADRLLTLLGLHISEIPDEIWRWAKRRKKEKGLEHLRNGKSVKQVAQWVGARESTVYNWKAELDGRTKKDAA